MNGTVTIGDFKVTRNGKRTRFTGPRMLNRTQWRELREKADEMLARGLSDRTAHREQLAREARAALARAQTLKPASVYKPVPRSGWHDASDSDRWGRRERNTVVGKRWVGGNCLRAAIASIIGADVGLVPDPSVEFNGVREGWVDRYDKRLREATGYRLERLPRSLCPPRDPNQVWIAGITMPGPDDHVVVARAHYVIHDSLGEFSGLLPTDRIIDGFIVRATQRVIPVLSPLGSGRAAVAA